MSLTVNVFFNNIENNFKNDNSALCINDAPFANGTIKNGKVFTYLSQIIGQLVSNPPSIIVANGNHKQLTQVQVLRATAWLSTLSKLSLAKEINTANGIDVIFNIARGGQAPLMYLSYILLYADQVNFIGYPANRLAGLESLSPPKKPFTNLITSDDSDVVSLVLTSEDSSDNLSISKPSPKEEVEDTKETESEESTSNTEVDTEETESEEADTEKAESEETDDDQEENDDQKEEDIQEKDDVEDLEPEPKTKKKSSSKVGASSKSSKTASSKARKSAKEEPAVEKKKVKKNK